MATWITCHNPHDVLILVNIDLVRTMRGTETQDTHLKFDEEHGIHVRETPVDIVNANPVGRR